MAKKRERTRVARNTRRAISRPRAAQSVDPPAGASTSKSKFSSCPELGQQWVTMHACDYRFTRCSKCKTWRRDRSFENRTKAE